jgi:hypothetical protein
VENDKPCFHQGRHRSALPLASNVPSLERSSVSTVSDYRLDDRGSIPSEAKYFSSSLCVQTGSEAHPAFCTMGTGVLSPGVIARRGRDADHSPPSSAEVVNE